MNTVLSVVFKIHLWGAISIHKELCVGNPNSVSLPPIALLGTKISCEIERPFPHRGTVSF